MMTCRMAAVHPRVLRCRIPRGGDRFWTVFGQVLGRFETVQSFKNVIDDEIFLGPAFSPTLEWLPMPSGVMQFMGQRF